MTVVVVTGTDTGVGKTVTTAALACAARLSGLDVAVCKPVQTGTIDGDEDVLDRQLPAAAGEPSEIFGEQRFRQALVAAIEGLPERERLVMGMYYEQDMNLKEIGAVLGVTESRVSQLHSQAVARLRTQMKSWK